jgi:uncharacterized sporulation protein YeaH/YhbH (DUF444 family)
MITIIDRRKNLGKKSSVNRKRAMDRSREALRDAVRLSTQRSITDKSAVEVKVKTGALEEPVFHRVFDGDVRHIVTGGNRTFIVGDRIPKDKSQQGHGGQASNGGGGEDEFKWLLTQDEYLDLIFDGLELPALLKKTQAIVETEAPQRDGLSTEGSMAQLDIVRSVARSMARRGALKRPKREDIEVLEKEVSDSQEPEKSILAEKLEKLKKRLRAVPWMDPVDIRFRHYDIKPLPISKAVVFCLMDVSGSMTEDLKDVAKRFFLLLHTFLGKKYKNLDVVLIRHTTEAEEVDEKKFFYEQQSGGTIVSSAYALMLKIQKERYPTSDYNCYCAQASDGDNWDSDNGTVQELLEQKVLPVFQYTFYIEVGQKDSEGHNFWGVKGSSEESGLWRAYQQVTAKNFIAKRILDVKDVYPVFREIFTK